MFSSTFASQQHTCHTYTNEREFADLLTKPKPLISIYSMLAYEQILDNAFFLINDLDNRRIKSFHALPFSEQTERKSYHRLLLDCYVRSDLQYIIEHIAAIIDPKKPGLEFVPSLAGFSHAHDNGRMIPPQIAIHMHNSVAQINSLMSIRSFINLFYAQQIFSIGNTSFYVANLLGGNFTNEKNVHKHPNWLSALFERSLKI